MSNLKLAALCAGALLAAAPLSATVTTVIDTGQGDPNNGWALSSSASQTQTQLEWAAKFTVVSSVTLTSLEASMFLIQSGDLTIALYDAAAGFPGASAALFSTTVTLTGSCCEQAWRGATGVSWAVGPGDYWFALQPVSTSNLFGSLNDSPASPAAAYALNNDGSWDGTGTTYGVRVLGTVPEPGTWALLTIGFGAVGLGLRRRKRVAA